MNNEILLNERVDVAAAFGSRLHLCEPRRFRRPNGREVAVTEVGLRHIVRRGRRLVHVFDVTDGQADYCLELDSERLVWTLVWEADRG